MAYLHAWSMYGAEAFEGPQLAAHYPTPPPEPLAAVAVRDVRGPAGGGNAIPPPWVQLP